MAQPCPRSNGVAARVGLLGSSVACLLKRYSLELRRDFVSSMIGKIRSESGRSRSVWLRGTQSSFDTRCDRDGVTMTKPAEDSL